MALDLILFDIFNCYGANMNDDCVYSGQDLGDNTFEIGMFMRLFMPTDEIMRNALFCLAVLKVNQIVYEKNVIVH